jgi:uncharacterized membrane protein YdcZ (DUF606 family)
LYPDLVDRPRLRLTDFSEAEGVDEMSTLKIMAIVLIVAGIVVLLYGKFSYTKETHDVKLGPLEMSIAEKQTVNVPLWAGVMAIVGGGVLLLYESKKR